MTQASREPPAGSQAQPAAEPIAQPATDIDLERRYQEIFENTPLCLWEEDYTELMAALEALKAQGIQDFHAYFAEHPEAVAELAAKVRILDVNAASLELFGAGSKEELLGSLDRLFTEESLLVYRRQLADMARGGRHFTSESFAKTLQGERIYTHVTFTIFPPRDGLIRALVSILDISKRRDIEEALRASEERYADLYDNAPDMFASLEPASGAIVQCNRTMARSMGYTKQGLAGRSVFDVIHPAFADEMRQVLAGLAHDDTVEIRHIQLQSRAGDVIDTGLKVSVVRDEDDDRVLWYSAVWRDISERRRAENELADKETLYRTLSEAIPHMIWMGDARGQITYCNLAMSALTGLSLEQARGRDWTDMLHADDHERICAVQEAARWNGQSYRGECRMRAADGRYRSVYFIVTPVKDEQGQVLHWVGINTDITELKRTQEDLQRSLERSNTELAQIAYAASHDLQEPLRMVTSYTQLIEKRYAGKLDEKADKYINYAVQGAKRIRRLIRDLLSFSRISMEGKALRPTPCATAIERAVAGLNREIATTGAKITYGDMPRIMADPAQLMLLFQHLLSNSIKFHSEEVPRIVVSAWQDGAMWVLSVKDNGIGFDCTAYGDRIFQMFQRLHPRDVYPGTGIGLALAKKIVERHGGRIWIESEPGQGATVSFTMPAVSEEIL